MGTVAHLLLLASLATGTLTSDCRAWIRGLRSETYDIGRQTGIVIDGDCTDWDDAFSVGPLADRTGRALTPEDFDVSVQLGWDDTGLLACFLIRDDVRDEAEDGSRIGGHDSVSIRVSDGLESNRFLIVDIAPGADERHAGTRVVVDTRGTVSADVVAAGKRDGEAFSLEVRVPLAPFGGGTAGREFAVQFVVCDRDGEGRPFRLTWFPWDDLSVGGMSHVVRLGGKSSQPIVGVASGSYEDHVKTRIMVVCGRDLMGRQVTFLDGGTEIAKGVLEEDGGRARATLTSAMPPRGAPYKKPVVIVEGGSSIPVAIPDADERRAWRFTWHRITFEDYAFGGSAFPKPKLDDPLFAEHLIGPYTILAEYYDRNYNRVEVPEKEGRYGAVISIAAKESGQVYRRFRTLYKYNGRIRWWDREVDGSIELPEEFGIDPVVLDEKRDVVAEHLKWQFRIGLIREQRTGALLAGLSESVPGDGAEGVYDNVWARDRAWWVGLKRKLYGLGPAEPLQCPTGVFKGRARELVFGSEEEAGFTNGATQAIDEVCREWWETSNEPFSVCIARNGKIAHLKSYGHREGRAVTLTTKTPIASITKLLTGTLMAMVIEHKRVDPDAPIATYLPAFRETSAGKVLTVRHLMNHTSGMEGHWGDEENDFEEQVAGYAPQMTIGKTYQFNGTALALAGKVIESVSGESLPSFIKHHLLDPLGCADTDVVGTSQDGLSTPLDLARIGQLLLNKGAYGDFRFFEYEAYQEMLPRPLSEVIPGTYRQYGFGTQYYRNEGLGEGTFGHGSASSTIFRVDPENDLVIVVSRWRAGDGYSQYKRRLFDTIVSHIAKKTES